MTNEQQVSAGARVERLLAEEDVQAAFAAIEQEAYKSFRSSETADAREAAWLIARGLDALKTELERVVQKGKVAAVAIEREKRRTR